MIFASRALLAAGLFAVLGIAAHGTAQAASDVQLSFVNGDEAVVAANVEIFLSNDHLIGQTDENGAVSFEVESGKGFWIEVNGERLAEFYFVEQAPYAIDLSVTDTIEWERK